MEQVLYDHLMKAITLLSVEVESLRDEIKKSNQQYLTLTEAEEYTRIKSKIILKAAEEKKELPIYSPQRSVRIFRKSDLDRWILQRRKFIS